MKIPSLMKIPYLTMMMALGLSFLIGCYASVHIDKRPNIALPLYKVDSSNGGSSGGTNALTGWVVLEQGYEVTYVKRGLSTEIQQMRAEIATNHTVVFSLGGYHSTLCYTNSISLNIEELFNFIKSSRNCSITNSLVTH